MLTFNTQVIFTPAAGGAQYLLDSFTSLEITSSWKNLGDMAVIKLGRLRGQFNKQLKEGDGVEIKLGYDGKLHTEFKGYIARLLPNQPFEMHCVDEVYHLQRSNLNKTWKHATLKEVIEEAIKGFEVEFVNPKEVPEVALAPFRVANASAAKVLQKLKDNYGLAMYFRGKQLYVGLPYSEDVAATTGVDEAPVVYDLQRNVLATELEYRRKEDIKIKLKATSYLKNNQKLEVYAGSEEGELRTWISPEPIADKDTLQKIANEKVKLYRYEGYKGGIKTLGIPHVVHSARCQIRDADYPEREGLYFVDEVKTTISKTGGFKRAVKIGRRAQ
ncbi:hypothetical protein [Microscilla marina]|uniref:Phage protein D n=1 Tax=Microscilla marina ATCC 23134 TaxID=313606 RepID=A1ZIG2_MICM2|nr:hypothetical protein [Microscilla marina]EAY29830.1 hypothetical protein M23134_05703 [Microscilla marina ATCC 23134]